MSLGASRYQVFIKQEGEPEFSPLGEERQTEFLTLENLLSGTYEAKVISKDAAGNKTESLNTIQFTL